MRKTALAFLAVLVAAVLGTENSASAAMVVHNNKSAVEQLNMLSKNSQALASSLSKVSAGMRINSEADDASGYAISERMRAQIRNLEQQNEQGSGKPAMIGQGTGEGKTTAEILLAIKQQALSAAGGSGEQQTFRGEISQADEESASSSNKKAILLQAAADLGLPVDLQTGQAVAVLDEKNVYIEPAGETGQENPDTASPSSSLVILSPDSGTDQESEPVLGVIADLGNGGDGLQATFRMYGYTYRIGGSLVLENGAVIQLGNPQDWSDLSQQFGLVVMDRESGRMNYYSTVGSESLGLFPGELVRNRQLVLSSDIGPIVVAFDGLGNPVYQGTLAEVDPEGTGIAREFSDAGYAGGLPGIPDLESFPEEYMGHHFAREVLQEPTCTEKGTSIVYCTDDGCSLMSYGEELPAAGHLWEAPEYTWTPSEGGYECSALRVCVRDGNHTESENASVASEITVAPACGAEGQAVFTASFDNPAFSSQAKTVVLLALAHEWDEGTETSPTCLEPGTITRTCLLCGRTETVPGKEAAGHDWQVSSNIPASCEQEGQVVYICSRCRDTYTETKAAAGHQYSVTESAGPTCTENGYMIHTCKVCENTFREEGENALGHDFRVIRTDPPTCLENGSETWQCSRCRESYSTVLEAPGSHDYTVAENVPATCTKDGHITHVCSRCGDTVTENLQKKGHEWGEGVVTASTCLQNGFITYTCRNCQETRTEAGEKAPGSHDYKIAENVPATCTKEGHITQVCSRCGDTVTETLQKAAHEWNEGVVTASTCLQDGFITYTCRNCQETRTEAGEKAPGSHDYKVAENVPATCTKDGHITHVCSRCGDTVTETLQKTAHEWGEGVVTASTCLQNGFITYTCRNCQETRTEAGEKAPGSHDYKISENVPATCTKDGHITHVCSRCGDTVTENLQKKGHEWGEGVVTASTCLQDGFITYTCRNCQETRTVAGEKAPGSHDYKITENVPATCTKEGHITQVCSRCGDTVTENLQKAAHEWNEGIVTAPTCKEDGFTTYTCRNCSETRTEAGEKALGGEHQFVSASDDNYPFSDFDHPVMIDGEEKCPVYDKVICTRCHTVTLIVIDYVQ